jgi:hypothetical protein
MSRSVASISYHGGDRDTAQSVIALCSDNTIWISYFNWGSDNGWSQWEQLPYVPGTSDRASVDFTTPSLTTKRAKT